MSDIIDETGDVPEYRLRAVGLMYPAQHSRGAISDGGRIANAIELGEGRMLGVSKVAFGGLALGQQR